MEKKYSKLTIIVLVHENHYYLSRCLDYLKAFELNAIIADSSSNAYVNPIPSNVVYMHSPEVSFPNKVCAALAKIKTEFIAVLAVDDFYSPQGLSTACDFLSKHDDYVSAAGDSILVNQYEYADQIKYQGDGGFSHGIRYDLDNVGDRLKQFQPRHYPLFYTVQRKSTALKVWEFYFCCERDIADFSSPDTIHFFELLGYLVVLLQGKHANLKVFFCLRDVFVYSAGENVKTFDYEFIKQFDVNIYDKVFQIASEIFKIELSELSLILDGALKDLSKKFKCRGHHPGLGATYQSLNSKSFYEFTLLTKIILQHRDIINNTLNCKYNGLPKYYDRYGQNWVKHTKSILLKKLPSDNQPIVIYGAGEHTQALLEIYDFNNVVAICDSCEILWGKQLQGIPIIAAHEILSYSRFVLISSQSAQEEIAQFLIENFNNTLSIIRIY